MTCPFVTDRNKPNDHRYIFNKVTQAGQLKAKQTVAQHTNTVRESGFHKKKCKYKLWSHQQGLKWTNRISESRTMRIWFHNASKGNFHITAEFVLHLGQLGLRRLWLVAVCTNICTGSKRQHAIICWRGGSSSLFIIRFWKASWTYFYHFILYFTLLYTVSKLWGGWLLHWDEMSPGESQLLQLNIFEF